MSSTRPLLILLLCAGIAGCAAKNDAPDRITSVRDYNANYLCDGGQAMHILFKPFKATLDSQGISIEMEQQPAADGVSFSGGGHSLRSVGDNATWTDDKGTVHQCKVTTVTPAK